jgi:hypothetical protein
VTWQATAPAGVNQVSAVSIGDSGTPAVLIHEAENVIGIQLITLQINSGVVSPAGGTGSGFLVEDTVTDGNGVQYGACEIGLAAGSGAGEAFNSTGGINLNGIILPQGVRLVLNNGGGGGTNALRRCSATVVYIVLTD